MAEVSTMGKITKIHGEGIEKNGNKRYKVFTLSEGHRDKSGSYKNIFFMCYCNNEEVEKIEEGGFVSIRGKLVPNIYRNKFGKMVYGMTLSVDSVVQSVKEAEPNESEEVVEEVIPFD